MKINGEFECKDVEFDGEILRNYSVPIERNASCKVETLAQLWVGADNEPNTVEVNRFTELLTLDVENAMQGRQPVRVKLEPVNLRRKEQEFEIPYGSSLRILEVHDLRPGDMAYDMRILSQ